MLNQQLANGIIGISIDMSAFDAGMAKMRASMAGLGAGGASGAVAAGVAAGVASGMSAGVTRGASQARNAMGQFTSQSVASGVAAGMTQGVARARGSFSAPLTQAVARATAAGMSQGFTDANGRVRDARGRFVGMGGGAGGAGGGAGRTAAGAAMGLMQGLGFGGFAMSPGQMAGQMIGGGLKDAVANSMELEQTFVGLQRVSGASAENVDKFKKTIFEIGKTQAGVSIKDLTDISMAGAKAGITDKEGLAGLETFTRGMAQVRNSVQGIGTEQLADNMVRMLNLFHKGTDYVQSFGSVLARMDNVSTSSAGDILDMSKSLSGTFASLGMGIPQVMAFSSVLSDVGLTNQQGASSFSQILRMMASDSADMATKIGVPIDVFQEKIRTDAMGALGMLIARFRELNEVDPLKAQEFIAGLGFRGVKTAGALQQLSSIFEQVQERTQMAIEEETTLGSLQAANNLNSTTALSNLQLLKNAFEQLADAIGSKLVKPLTAASQTALSFVNQIGREPGKAGPDGKATNPLSVMEGLEFAGMSALNSIGGAIPNDPAFQAKLNAYKQRLEESFAAGDGKALEAAAAEAQPPKMKPGIAAAIGEGGAPSRGAFASAAAAAARVPAGAEGQEAMRMFLQRPTNAEMRGEKEDKIAPERFSSQHFGDGGDFARNAIQTALSDKDNTPKQAVEEQKKTNSKLDKLIDTVLTGTGMTPMNNGPMILRGPA